MTKYLSLLLLGSMVQFVPMHAGCKDGSCKKDRLANTLACKDKTKDKTKKADKNSTERVA